ncbi:hypothetical protein N7510_002958 [Penicillium lagena]|uniref:uncharacterized protein n=1 Tax=Penicillium lagena TaxID=94218 RepID=UPI0025417337|nr:uncharacterized protein N7510_002958 [Penicillium lagena]KAJ5618974.1 hypothetical protein N7510_002958 [Penicillium lagena]
MFGPKTLFLAAAALLQTIQVVATNCQVILTDTSIFDGSGVIENESLVIYKNGAAVGYHKGNPYGNWIDIDSSLPWVFVFAAESDGAGVMACVGKYAAQTNLKGKVSGSGLQADSKCVIDFNC